jgi:hypothetical protein
MTSLEDESVWTGHVGECDGERGVGDEHRDLLSRDTNSAPAIDFATEAREYWARIGHGSGVITFSGARFEAQKSRLTRHFGSSRTDDHGIRMTSLIILVIWLFE